MGCEPRGFGWSATAEVCSARVTRLVTGLKNLEKFSTRQPVPGTVNRCLAPGAGTRFARVNWCLASTGAWHRAQGRDLPASTGAWHRARGRDLPAFRFGDRKGAWHRARGCLAPGAGARFASISIQGSKRCLANGTDFYDVSRCQARDEPQARDVLARIC
jgi:hypothetical protein